MSNTFSHILKTAPFAEQDSETVLKFNHRHDTKGRFTSGHDTKGGEQSGDKKHVSTSGKHHLTTARVSGKDFASPKAAIVSGTSRKRGREAKVFAHSAEAHGAAAAGLHVTQKAGSYKKGRALGGKNQAVHIGEIRSEAAYGDGGKVSNDHLRQKGKDILATSAAANGGKVTQFHSVPGTARKRDRAKHFILNTQAGHFKNMAEAEKAVADHGLEGVAHVTHNAETGGHEIHIPVANMKTSHGLSVAKKAKDFHRAHEDKGMQAEHHNGERVLDAAAKADAHIQTRPDNVKAAHSAVVAAAQAKHTPNPTNARGSRATA